MESLWNGPFTSLTVVKNIVIVIGHVIFYYYFYAIGKKMSQFIVNDYYCSSIPSNQEPYESSSQI